MDKYKPILPISILLGCIILGGFYCVSKKMEQKQDNAEIKRKMMFECEEYGNEKYGTTYEYNSLGTLTQRKYYFSPKLNSCVMEQSFLRAGSEEPDLLIVNMNKEENLFEYSPDCFNYYSQISSQQAEENCLDGQEYNKRREQLLK
jgi:nitrogen fixation-related uncharacterized protein